MAASTFIRFQDGNGTIHYGQPTQEDLVRDLTGATVDLLQGGPFGGLEQSGGRAKVAKVG